MKVNTGIDKGDNSDYQDLLDKYNKALEEIKLLQERIKKKEKLNRDFIDLQEFIDMETERRVFNYIGFFAKQIHHESGKEYNERLDKRLSIHNDIFDRLKAFEEILIEAAPKYRKLFDGSLKNGGKKMHETKKLFEEWAENNKDFLNENLKIHRNGKTLFHECNEYLKNKFDKQIKLSTFHKYLGSYKPE